MGGKRLIDRVRTAIDGQGRTPFTAQDIIKAMGRSDPFNWESARIAITRDLLRKGEIKKVGNRGRKNTFIKVQGEERANPPAPIHVPKAAPGKEKTKTDLVRNIIRGFKGREFTVPEIIEQLSARGVDVHKRTLSVMISGELCKKQQFMERVGKKGVLSLYRQCPEPSAPAAESTPHPGSGPEPSTPAPDPATREEKTKTDIVRDIIRGFKGREFTTAEIKEQLSAQGIQIDKNVFGVMISRQLCSKQHFIERVGKKGVLSLYRQCPEPSAPAPDPVPRKRTKTDAVRDIIQGFNGREFTAPEIVDQLSAQGIQIGPATFSVMMSRELVKKQGFIERVGKRGVYTLYRQGSESSAPGSASETPTDPRSASETPTDPRSVVLYDGSFPALFLSVAAGLERFSLEYLQSEVGKTGKWDRPNFKHTCYVFISTLKKRGLIVASHERPTVYSMTPDFYLYNVNHLIMFTDTAPHLEQRIMQKFAKHCGPDPEPKNETNAPEKTKTEPIKQSVETTAPKTVNPAETTIVLGEKERQQLEKEILKIKDKLNDRNLDIITLTSRNRDLENKVQKLNREIGRLTAKVDEKDRINSALQRRLNIARDELSKKKIRQDHSFSLGELAHIK
jgi:acetolactate synthase small subunit